MKGNLFKKVLAAATSFLMLAGGVSELPFAGIFENMTITASAETGITYVDADGTSQTISDYTSVASSSTAWSAGTYAVTASTTISDRVTVSGAVDLILCDGVTLDCEKGITVAEGDSLTIYGCTAGTGKLTATGEYYSAGIGSKSGAGGNITINGGNITATGGFSSAGIGGVYDNGAGNITINGGTVTATGGSSGAGIGCGLMGWGGDVTINGGKITAIDGGSGAAGIGNGALNGSCTVTLGWKNADDSIYASSYDRSDVKLSKPFVFYDDTPAYWNSKVDNNINGKTIYPLKLDVAIDNSITNGTVSADKTSNVLYGETVTLTVTPDAGCKLKSLTVRDSSDTAVTVTDNQFVMPDSNVTVTAEFEQYSLSYIGSSGSSVSLSSTGYTLVNSSTTVFSGIMVVPADTTVNLGNKKITLENGTNLILCDGSELVIGSDSYNDNCLFGSHSALRIYGQSGQTGKLTLKSSSSTVEVQSLSIYGGEISVNGENGIVCSYSANIARGKVTATAVNTAINCIQYISVSGGEVNATATDGSGLYAGSGITISGGKIEAQGTAAGIKSETGNITLGWKEADDFIKASSYSGTVAFGKSMTDGTTDYPVGTLTPDQVGAIANQKLVAPAITYIDGNGTPQTVSDYTSATSNATTWSTGTYVVSEDTVINSRVTVDGAVDLILCDGVTLNCKAGITVTDPNSLTVYGCAEGTGMLTATGRQYSAGIGGGTNQTAGTIIIYGGKVTAAGGEYGTGIGGGWQSKGSTVKIYGGEVTATGGHAAAGIGGGYNSVAGTVIIYGGSVTVTGGGDAAGIGGGSWCTEGTVKIYGGTVTTTVDEDSACGAGIGCGEFGEAVNVTITGGTVTANGGSLAAGIGGSYGSAGARVTINGGTVTANGGYNGAGIGTGASCGRTSNIITINGGTVTATGGSYSAGIGGGEDSEGGTIRIYGGKVEAVGGENAVGIGGGTKFDSDHPDGIPITNNCTIFLRWTTADDSIYAPSYRGTVTLSKQFVLEDGTAAAADNIAGHTITPLKSDVFITGSAHGTVTADKTDPVPVGKTVTLTVTPDTGCRLISLTVTDSSGNPVTVTDNQFIMPDNNVTVTAEFEEIDYAITIIPSENGTASAKVGDTANAATAHYGETVTVLPPVSYLLNALTVTDSSGSPIPVTGNHFTMPAGDVTVTAVFEAQIPITYKLEDGTSQTVSAYNAVTADSAEWEDDIYGIYAVTENTTITARVTVTGDVTLILCDGVTLDCEKGITVAEGSSLTVYECEAGTGKLNATGATNCAGIGGSKEGAGGTIIINGGTVSATGGSSAAGIGGGFEGAGGNITINGGTVTATGNGSSAGIGGGYNGEGGTIIINGGEVTATGGGNAAGIGGGYNGEGGTITINDGTVTATGGDSGAGIGGGIQGAGGNITINGGTVTATAGENGAGIGGGNHGAGGTTTISGGTVTATAGKWGAGIGGGNGSAGGTITINDGTVTATGGEDGAGIGSGDTSKNSGVTETIIINGGTIIANGQKKGAGIGGGSNGAGGNVTINGGKITATGGEQGGVGIGNGAYSETEDFTITILGGEVEAYGGQYAAGIGGGNQSTCDNITITDGKVTATGGKEGAGIGSGSYGSNNKVGTISISGGEVEAVGGEHAAGIGGGDHSTCDNITITDGKVTATGGDKGAGIGSGSYGTSNKVGTISISGGEVEARGGQNSAGIGGGYYGAGGTITISGGTVTATGDGNGTGIGGGYNGEGGNITISGGQVTAEGGQNAAGIGGGIEITGQTITRDCTIELGWTNADDSITATSCSGTVIFTKPFVLDGTHTLATAGNLGNQTLTPIEGKANVVIADSITNGTVTADQTSDVYVGETVTLTVTPDAGYALKSLTVTDADGNAIEVVNNQFTMPVTDATVTAEFVRGKTYSYELTDSYGDGWNGNAIKVYDITNEVPVLVAELTITSGSSASGTLLLLDSNIYIFEWVTGRYSYECSFEIKEAGETVSSCSDGSSLADGQVLCRVNMPCNSVTIGGEIANGSVTADKENDVYVGETVTLTVIPDAGYMLKSLTVTDADSNIIPVSDNYQFIMPATAVTVTAEFRMINPVTAYMNLTIIDGSAIGINFYFEVNEGEEAEYTVNFGEQSTLISDLPTRTVSGKTLPCLSMTAPAKRMTDTMIVTLMHKGTVIKRIEKSIVDYSDMLLADPNAFDHYDLIKAMLNYGAAAQTFFAYETGNLANQDYPLDYSGVMIPKQEFTGKQTMLDILAAADSPVSYYAMNLSLESETALSIHFNVKDDYTMEQAKAYLATFKVDGSPAVVDEKDGRPVITIKNIPTKDLFKTYSIAKDGQSFGVSVDMYMTAVMNGSDDNLKALCKALYKFYLAKAQ